MPAQKPVASKQPAPSEVVEKMYMQVNNISQGFAIAILIDTLAKRFTNGYLTYDNGDFSALLLAFTSLCISIIFWTRYYFDTFIIKRSFSVRSMVWFFAYVVAEGFSFKQIDKPINWFVATGIFLVFGIGFYILNLAEIQRKQKDRVKLNLPEKYVDNLESYILWQKLRLIDLFIVMGLAFTGAVLASAYSFLQYPIAVITLIIAVWQLSKSRDYKKFGFSNSYL